MRSAVCLWAVLGALLGAGVARGGDSAAFLLDTRSGERVAGAVERIAYSTAWNGGASVRVAVDGETLLEAAAPASGVVLWNAAEAGGGVHTLTHESGGATLSAVFTVPVLEADSADWSAGSITLRCTDGGASGAGNKYTLQYYDEGSGAWVDVEGAKDQVAGADGSVLLTDTEFSSRLGGVPPVKYRARDENGGASGECVTRAKYGIFVSPGGYAPEMGLEAYPSASTNYAATFGRLASGLGGFSAVHPLTGSDAVYDKIDGAFKSVVQTVKPGDVCFLYFGTHGGLYPNSTSSRLALYRGDYEEEQLANHIKLLNGVDEDNPGGTGVAVVGFVQACHSKAVADNENDWYCQPGSWCVNSVLSGRNCAWVTATDDPKALSIGDYFSLFLLDYGWERGWAGETGEALSCKALADYAKERTDAVFDGLTMKNGGEAYTIEVGVEDSASILRHIFIGRCGSHAEQNRPDNPSIAAEAAVDSITVTVRNVRNADRLVFFKRCGADGTWESWYTSGVTGNGAFPDTEVDGSGRNHPNYYQVRAMNGAGVGKSNVESAWRILTGGMTQAWLDAHPALSAASGGDIATAAAMTAANGCRTVGECYALGIDPEDPEDDLRITRYEGVGGKPVLTLNHTADGSGKSFAGQIRTFGAKELDEEDGWEDVTEMENPGAAGYRFFRAEVEMP